MITKDNLRDVLLSLEFDYNKSSDTYYRAFRDKKCEVLVNFKEKSIIYPEKEGFKVNDKTTCNFEHPENFVVLECVCRLFEKGYRPEHIELEKRWNLGHDAKGGKADICVYNKNGKDMLLIIECKTFGPEHNKALKQLKEDGGQLFSYWQQERSTQWLSLYTSDFQDGNVVYENKIIHCVDDDEVRKLAKKDKTQKLYDNARTVQDLFEVWNETYDKRILNKGVIFGEESSAYQIGIPPLRKKHLVEFTDDGVVNKFEEILRHNNVSDKENAFNRLIALFICKLVDEIQKNDDDIVEFQYKMGETYESLQDRLQRLHQEGMSKFMREDIYYVPDDYAEKLFANNLNAKNRQAAIDSLRETIRILKFYSNNDFSFKDVHNEQLFYQNGKVLVEVVELFQGYRIVYPSKQQFLGDLFEQLLSKGFKQNEGQFFTPMPITRFIWDCLPLEKIIVSKSGFKFPKVIDYACGAGHFLTEGIEAINDFFQYHGKAKRINNNAWVEHSIFGIEKDYRLARVAKVSLYMNGAGLGNIKFGDGLESYPEEEIKDGSFDILVANPPYSVSGFKMHLNVKDDDFDLLKRKLISNEAKEIETLFVERISQLLKPCGIAAVILPAPILDNESACYIGARELLLQNFYLRGIVQFGNQTFGATGTNTVVLFLEKYDEPPKKKELIKDSVNAILAGDVAEGWDDENIFKAYLEQINVTEELYKSFVDETASYDTLRADEYFAQYIDWFEKQKQKKKETQNFFKRVKEKEWEKIFYYALVCSQKTAVISAPENNKEQKKFLGYEWSNRNGKEGIKIRKKGGLLYDDADRYANNTLASTIQSMFNGKNCCLPEEITKYYELFDLQDLIDFRKVVFNKKINLSVGKQIEIQSRYPLVYLGGDHGVCDIRIGGTPSRDKADYFTGTNLWVSVAEMKGQVITDTKEKITAEGIESSNVKLIPAGTTLLSFKLSIGKTAIAGADLYTNEAIAALVPNDQTQISNEYLFALFHAEIIDLKNVGNKAFGKSLNSKYLKNEVKIPLPPMTIQQQLVADCMKVDEEYNQTRMSKEEYKNRIAGIFDRLGVILKQNDDENNSTENLA
jgi:type I restriction-modification system DNA methylase subunit